MVALSILPEGWTGAEPVRIVENMAAGLLTTLNANFVYVAMIGSEGNTLASLALTDRFGTDAKLAASLGPALLDWARRHDPMTYFCTGRRTPRSG